MRFHYSFYRVGFFRLIFGALYQSQHWYGFIHVFYSKNIYYFVSGHQSSMDKHSSSGGMDNFCPYFNFVVSLNVLKYKFKIFR